MPEKISVRPARPGDGAALWTTTRALAEHHDFLDGFVAKPEDYERDLFAPHPVIGALIAEDDGVLAGSALWHRSYSTNRGREIMYLEDVVVLPEHRRKGVAKALFKAVAQVALAQGYSKIYWMVLDWNEGAKTLYRALGAAIDPDHRLCTIDGDALKALAG
jgi:GNAT superfamily N-acetyltransferase